MSQPVRHPDDERGRSGRGVRSAFGREALPALPGPRALWPHEKVGLRRDTPHPSAAFPLMAPAAAQGRPGRAPVPRIEARVDALLAEAQQALERMRARAQMVRDALREARQTPVAAARGRFEVPRAPAQLR